MPTSTLDNPKNIPFGSSPSEEEFPTAAQSGEGLQWTAQDTLETVSSGSRRRSVPQQDIAEFTSQLAIMSQSGVDIATALGSLARQCQRPALAKVLFEVHESVLSGSTFSEALRHQTDVFDHSFIATVAAGEASGRMSEVLRQLAQMKQSEMKSRRTLKAMMTYPVLLMGVSATVIICLMLFVLPRFAEIFSQYDITLPLITQVLIAIADEIRGRWWFWIPLLIGSVVGLLTWRKTSQGRLVIDNLLLNSPIIYRVSRSLCTARTCQLLGLMLESGVPLLESLRLSRQAAGNVHYKNLLSDSEEAVINGRNLASVWETCEIVPESAREMIITAEKTGNIGEVSRLLGEYYDEDAHARMRQMVGMIEPIITVGMGFVVACVVLAVMLPVFDLSTIRH